MCTKLVRLTGITAALLLALGLGTAAQAGMAGQPDAQHVVVADNQGPATVEP
ncbi:hypothetical protein GCM10010266_34200 [Streptomyces griseomycini]|uniref:hypothetical protein n=1 Tax=Streptomyces griseomycini TaxID=66895 RepID=UPI0018748EDE|nr:hypothetical protein [Streptomyces griseomycini]GGQ08072.1 hypothetical protein GCM10010266_34200 [Streptomyces griseomycini]